MPEGGVRISLANLARTFGLGGLFSPGKPLPPSDGQQPVRPYDFPVGQNLQWTPRSYEPFTFQQLRAFSNIELVRLAIEKRKDQIERLDWQVKPKDGRKPRADAEDRIRAAHRLLKKPDGTTEFSLWMRQVFEDLLSIDAVSIERRWSAAGKLKGLDVVDGSTIKLLIDDTGRIPLAPAPAYQQIIKGRIWSDLTTRDLIYAPRNRRPGHIYGFSPVEQIVVTINTIFQRQASQLAYFTEGNVPQGLINAPDTWTVEQIRQFQDWFDAKLSGNPAERRKLIWAPAASKYTSFKESPIKDEFDEWLARIVCYAFSLPPTAFIKSMNRSASEQDAERAEEEGLDPLKTWAKRLLDHIIQEDLGFADLEFAWAAEEDTDPNIQSQIADRRLKAGAITLDEYRHEIGLEPLAGDLGKVPLIYTGTGVVRLEDAIAAPKAETEAPKPDPEATDDGDATDATTEDTTDD